MVREIYENELKELLELYLHLHEKSVPAMTEHLNNTWKTIMQDKNHHIIVNVIEGKNSIFLRMCNHTKFNKKYKAICFCRKCCYKL